MEFFFPALYFPIIFYITVSGERGVTQGDPLPPTIFNVVVDAVVRHWLEGIQAAKEEKGA